MVDTSLGEGSSANTKVTKAVDTMVKAPLQSVQSVPSDDDNDDNKVTNNDTQQEQHTNPATDEDLDGSDEEDESGEEDESDEEGDIYEDTCQNISLRVGDLVKYIREGRKYPTAQSTVRDIDSSLSSIVLTDNSVLKSSDRVLLVKDRMYLQVDEFHLNNEGQQAGSSPEISDMNILPINEDEKDDDESELSYSEQDFLESCKEVLKSGDSIQYYHEMEGHKTREILQIRHPTDSPYSVVVVDDFYAIGRNKRVRLVERSLPDGSTEKVYGVFRDVKKFILKVGGRQDGLSGVVTDRANEVNKTRDKVRRKAMEEMKKDGTEVYSDLLD